jgi:hypothetical protein
MSLDEDVVSDPKPKDEVEPVDDVNRLYLVEDDGVKYFVIDGVRYPYVLKDGDDDMTYRW